jgi:hypothetical protein
MLGAELGHASWSIPGAFDALRSFALPRAIAVLGAPWAVVS